MHGYGAPPLAAYSGQSFHVKNTSPSIYWSVVSHDKGPYYGGNHNHFSHLCCPTTTPFLLRLDPLMESFLETHNVTSIDLCRLNLCRIYLRAEFLSEIYNPEGDNLLAEV